MPDVESLLKDVSQVSSKTYQWHLLGQGVRPGGLVEARVRAAAKLGYLRSYVVFVDSEPVAFQIGYGFGRVYSAHETGFDPDWRRLQPGKFLLTEIFHDLATNSRLDLFDFQLGDSSEKRRFSNQSHQERHYYLFPRTWRGTALAHTKRVVDGTSATLGRVAKTLRAKDAIRRALRLRAVGKTGASGSN